MLIIEMNIESKCSRLASVEDVMKLLEDLPTFLRTMIVGQSQLGDAGFEPFVIWNLI